MASGHRGELRMAGLLALVVVVLSAGPAMAQAQATNTYAVVIDTPVSSSTGRPFGASTPFLLTPGERRVIFATSGANLCMAGNARTESRADAGFGWRLEVLLREITDKNELVIDATWQRQWQNGRAIEGPVTAIRRQLQLPEGGRVQLDYLPAGEADADAGCHAVGMALELSRRPRPSTGLFELDLWLMAGASADGTVTQRQTLRTRLGDAASFYFDDVVLEPGGAHAQVEGSFELRDLLSGRFDSRLTIARKDRIEGRPLLPSGSSTFPFNAALGEVVEFRVPMGGFSLRVRLRQLR